MDVNHLRVGFARLKCESRGLTSFSHRVWSDLLISLIHETFVEFHCQSSSLTDHTDTLLWVVKLKPDVLLADLRMSGTTDYAESIREIVAACFCPVLLMSFTADAESQLLATNAGAVRLLDKTTLYDELVPAIDQALGWR
jgi:DNA-binding NtrC family response regulator